MHDFNYVAQPGDMERGVRMMPPRFGLYDDYLIRWNYTPVPEAKQRKKSMRLLQSGLRIYPVILYIGMENNSRIYLTLVLKRKTWEMMR